VSNGGEPGTQRIEPLRKRKLGSGPVYTRPKDIEQLLQLLITLPSDEAIARARIRNRRAPGWLPGECVVHMTRRAARKRDQRSYQRWYEILAERIRAGLPRSADQYRSAARELEIGEAGFDRFLEMLATDVRGYDERLDIWEARFDLALANLRRDALRKVLPAKGEPETVEIGDDPLLAAEVERARGAFDPFDPARLNEADFRSRLWHAIDELPTEQNRIITMTLQGIPIGTGAAGEQSISTLLGMQPRTINNHKNRAYDAIRRAMEGDDA
jgi:DNA-directed RNA polymerase specialized sigma24 family protein